MELERHCATRHSLEFDVTLRYGQRRFPVARARDLSPVGLYVQTAKLTLPIGTLIEIELDRWGRQWLIPAVVVGGDAQGVGLSFQTPQPELFRLESAALTGPCPPASNPGVAASAT